jgi:hypothetical protein
MDVHTKERRTSDSHQHVDHLVECRDDLGVGGIGSGATHDRTKILGWETVCPGASLTGPAGQIFPSLQVTNAGAQGTPNSPRHGIIIMSIGNMPFMRCPWEKAGLSISLTEVTSVKLVEIRGDHRGLGSG